MTTELLIAPPASGKTHTSIERIQALTKIFLPTGKKVVVVGSDLAALEAVEFLVHRGKEVTLVDTAPQIGKGVGIMQILKYPIWLQAVGVKMLLDVKEMKEVPAGLLVIDKDGKEQTIECDSMMVVSQFTHNDKLNNELEGIVAERYLVGDARAKDDFAYIHGAMRDGADAGLSI